MRLALLLALCLPVSAQAPTTVDYGKACGGSLLLMTLPKIGEMVDVTVLNDDATAGLIAVGFAQVKIFMGGTAPHRCYLLVDPFALVPFTSLGGNGSAKLFTLPNNTSLVGVTFFVQAVSFDTSANSWTQGIRATVGL